MANATSTLILHCGAVKASRAQVVAIEAPPATRSWHPISHGKVLATVESTLSKAGYVVAKSEYGLTSGGNRFFAALDLKSQITDGIALTIGLRNSIDKSFPYGLAGGTRTVVCDNLAFTGDWDSLTISKKHTINGETNFDRAIAHGISQLAQYQDFELKRIETMRSTYISDQFAEAMILRAYEQELISHQVLRKVILQWRKPQYDWGGKTLWTLYNALNTPLQGRFVSNPPKFAQQTQGLMALVSPNMSDVIIDVPAADTYVPPQTGAIALPGPTWAYDHA